MGTGKSAVSRLESAGKHAPSLATLKRCASALGVWAAEGNLTPDGMQRRHTALVQSD